VDALPPDAQLDATENHAVEVVPEQVVPLNASAVNAELVAQD